MLKTDAIQDTNVPSLQYSEIHLDSKAIQYSDYLYENNFTEEDISYKKFCIPNKTKKFKNICIYLHIHVDHSM